MEPGDVIGTLLIFCPLAMYIVASEVVVTNALVSMVIPLVQSVDSMKVTDARLEHDLNACDPMEATDAGMTMEVSADSRNALYAMVNSSLPVAKETDARVEHERNAAPSMDVTDDGMVMEVSAVFSNAELPMVNSPLSAAKETDARLEQ